jgi:hypothetical protein
MKHFNILTSIAFALTLAFSANAQVSISPNPVTVPIGNFGIADVVAHSEVTNNASATAEFVWSRTIVFMTTGWDNAVCDRNQCHFITVSEAPFFLDAAETETLDVHCYPNGIPGWAVIEVKVTEMGNESNFDIGTYYFNTATSVSERLTNAIAVYPNPVSDILFIETANLVHRMDFFGMDGKLIDSKMIFGKNSVEVGNLATGTYVLRMLDKDGFQVSSNLIVKQ